MSDNTLSKYVILVLNDGREKGVKSLYSVHKEDENDNVVPGTGSVESGFADMLGYIAFLEGYTWSIQEQRWVEREEIKP